MPPGKSRPRREPPGGDSMADIADVETAILALIGDALAGEAFRAFRGWPTPAALETDLREGITQITVTPREGVGRVTTRHLSQTSILPPVPVTLHPAVSASSDAAGFTGRADRRHVAGVAVRGRAGVPDQAYCVACLPGEEAAAVATRIAAMIPGAARDGALISVPNARLEARTASHAETSRELRRQDAGFQIDLWCPDPEARDVIGRKVDAAMALAEDREWLALPGGEAGWIRGGGSHRTDKGSGALTWRRTFFVQVEYPTTWAAEVPRLLFAGIGSRAAMVKEAMAVTHIA